MAASQLLRQETWPHPPGPGAHLGLRLFSQTQSSGAPSPFPGQACHRRSIPVGPSSSWSSSPGPSGCLSDLIRCRRGILEGATPQHQKAGQRLPGAGAGHEGTFRATERLHVLTQVEVTRLFALRFDTLMKMTAATKPAQAPQPAKCSPSTHCVPGTVLGAVDKTPIPWGRWEPADAMTTGT